MSKQEPIGLLVAAVRRQIKQAVTRGAAPHGLSSQQFWLLVAVRENPRFTARELAQRQRMDEPTASRVLSALTRMKLVTSTVDPEDRRKSRLQLTAKGQKLADQLAPFAMQVRQAPDEALTAPERAELRRLLNKVLHGIAELGVTHGPEELAEARR